MPLASLGASHRGTTHVVLDGESEVVVSGLRTEDLTVEELHLLSRLATIVRSESAGIVLRRNRNHRVGRIVIRNVVVTVPPPFDPHLFVAFFLYASGSDLAKFMERTPARVDLSQVGEADRFLALLSLLLVELAEQILRTHVARAYVPQESRLKTIRGRPMWGKDFGRHPAEGLTSRYHLLETDNELNRLILAGLLRAETILRESPWATAAYTQGFVWRSIASISFPSYDHFRIANTRLTRLTHHYGAALHLARTLLFGGAPEDPFAGKSSLLQGLEFNLPSLFERFVARLLAEAGEAKGLRVSAQERDRNALVDGYGETYRAVQPDLIVYRQAEPVAVIDAKFKPRYGQGNQVEPVPTSSRVDSADIYQVFFYEARLRHAFGLKTPIPALILAPSLGDSSAADRARRTIAWRAHAGDAKHPYELRVVRLPLEEMILRLSEGDGAAAVVGGVLELEALLATVSAASTLESNGVTG